MVIKLRFPRSANAKRNSGTFGYLAGAAAGLFTMTAVGCLLLALWRLTSDLEWTDPFFIADGILSHWQVWLALTFLMGTLAVRLRRYSRLQDQELSSVAPALDFEAVAPVETAADPERAVTR